MNRVYVLMLLKMSSSSFIQQIVESSSQAVEAQALRHLQAIWQSFNSKSPFLLQLLTPSLSPLLPLFSQLVSLIPLSQFSCFTRLPRVIALLFPQPPSHQFPTTSFLPYSKDSSFQSPERFV
jgi:hypothetical protein